MFWRGLKLLALCVVVGLAVLRIGCMTRAAEQRGTLSLKKVWSFTEFSWPSDLTRVPQAFFDPEGGFIYFIHNEEPRLEILDWKTGKSVGERNYKKLLANDARISREPCRLQSWEFLTDAQYDLMNYCGSLVLVDHNTLAVDRVLLYEADDLGVRGYAYCKAQGYLAVYLDNQKGGADRIRVYITKDWQVAAEWGIPFADSIAITPGGGYLAMIMSHDEVPLFSPGRYTLELRELLSGKVVCRCNLAYDIKMGPPSKMHFLPDSDYTFLSFPVPFNYIGVWDARSGALLRRIEERRTIGARGNWDVSPDGRWVAASARSSPEDDHEGQQDFKIWDVRTGAVVYETPLQPWRFPLTKTQMGPLFVDFSPDSHHLLVLKYKELAVYEISEGSRSK